MHLERETWCLPAFAKASLGLCVHLPREGDMALDAKGREVRPHECSMEGSQAGHGIRPESPLCSRDLRGRRQALGEASRLLGGGSEDRWFSRGHGRWGAA